MSAAPPSRTPRAGQARPGLPRPGLSRPGPYNSAREVAVRVLLAVLEEGAFAAPTLDAALDAARLPARDAGLATHIVYGTLRHLPSLRAALTERLTPDTHPKVWALLLAGTFEKGHLDTPAHAVVNEYVNLAGGARLAPPGLVNAVLRRIEPRVVSPEHELPGWLAEVYRAAYGEHAPAVFADLLRPQPLWLSLTERGEALLRQEGSAAVPGPQGVDRVDLTRPLRETAAYREGQAQPINPASLACVDALGEVGGRRVLDLAGGAGVKAAMLASRGAEVTSVDVAGRKHAAARRNLARLGLRADFVTHDLTRPLDRAPAPFVLLDAPCSGSGTLRSHPEIKLRLTPAQVTELAGLQRALLEQAARLVEPGGVLVYAVCAVTPQEGPEVVEAFLAGHPEFAVQDVPGLEVPSVGAGPGRLTVPVDGIDGFFIARLERTAG